MRKFFCSLLMALLPLSMYAADMIITTKSEKLEVKIIEVSSTEIRYKKMSNLEGPTFVISTSDINSILYENGDVQVIEHKATVQPQMVQSYPQVQQSYPQTQPYGYSVQPSYGQPNGYSQVQFAAPGYIVRQGTRYSFNGQKIRLHDFLDSNCPFAYDYWRKNFIMECVGWGAMGAGTVFFFWGVAGLSQVPNSSVGIAMTVVGAGLMGAGVSMGTVGYIRRAQKAVDLYNQQCTPRYSDVRIDLRSSQNGLGLAFVF